MLLMLSAELSMGAYAASWLRRESPSVIVLILVATLLVTVAAGGMRSLSWSTSAQSIASLIALLGARGHRGRDRHQSALASALGGPVLRSIARGEAAQGLPIILPPALAFDMPGQGLSDIAKRYSDAFGSVGPRCLRHRDVVDAGRHRQRAMAAAPRRLDAGRL